MNVEEEFKKVNEQMQVLRSCLEGTTDATQRENIIREIAHNNGKIAILRELI